MTCAGGKKRKKKKGGCMPTPEMVNIHKMVNIKAREINVPQQRP